jgi:hypothetical protein
VAATLIAAAWLVGLSAVAQAAARPPMRISPALRQDDHYCLGCHGPETHDKEAPLVDTAVLEGSSHGNVKCASCHTAITFSPHRTPVPAVDCTRCHSGDTRQASLKAQAGKEAPLDNHSEATQQGAKGLPKCEDCHGKHDIRAPSATGSRVGRVGLADTCGTCHTKEAALYEQSAHGKAATGANREVPTCITCHPEHARLGKRGVFQVGVVQTCGSCHENAELEAKYAIPADRLTSYLGSYHGMATELGDKRTANCASCHGNHLILPSSDPRATTNRANLPRTCGKCHPKVNGNVARGKIHVMATPTSAALLYRINVAFRWFTLGTIGLLLGHISLELFGRLRGRNGGHE